MKYTKQDIIEYRAKRSFKETPEPKKSQRKVFKKIFVVQKHDASHLHYDFRFAFNKVLKSWAIPKGPVNKTGIRRLAIPTEDHPYDYARFHGIIPKGHYGAGTVEIWDKGTFKNIRRKSGKIVPLRKCLEEGRVELWLEGGKLNGAFALIRTGINESGKEQWLFFKMVTKGNNDE